MSEESTFSGTIRDRLILALADPDIAGKAGRGPAALIAHHEAMAVFEWLGHGKGLVVLEQAKIPMADLRAQIDRVIGAHERGLLFVAVAGGGSEIAELLRNADSLARNRDQLGVYHIDDQAGLHRIAGRRLPELEKACQDLPRTRSLGNDDIAAIVERGRKERLDAMEFVRGNVRRFPQVTIGYMALCLLLFAAMSGDDARGRILFESLCNSPDLVRRGEIWRLLSYAFLHNNATHLMVNLLSLYSMGSFIEPMLGRRRYALLCLVTGVAGGLASALLAQALSVGASGVVWGLLGATFGMILGKRQLFPKLIARDLRQRLVIILAINVLISFLPHIDRYCHFGGGLAGYLFARFFAREPTQSAAN